MFWEVLRTLLLGSKNPFRVLRTLFWVLRTLLDLQRHFKIKFDSKSLVMGSKRPASDSKNPALRTILPTIQEEWISRDVAISSLSTGRNLQSRGG